MFYKQSIYSKTTKLISLALGLFITMLAATASAEESQVDITSHILPPQWAEFCSGIDCEASKMPVPEIKPRPAYGMIVLGTFIPIILPFLYKQQSVANRSEQAWLQATHQNYWANRHEQFKAEVSNCQVIKDESKLVDCYMDVRQLENSKNQAMQQESLMQQQINAVRSLRPLYY